jgi:hypothetical protein
MLIQLLAVVGAIGGFVAITLSVAAGLYYFSEIIEENLQLTKRFLHRAIIAVSAVLALLVVSDGFPLKLTLFSLCSNYVYSRNLKKFPNIQLSDPTFLATCILAFINHYLWFNHFNNPYIPTIDERLNPDFKLPYYPSFTEIASFFGICVWMIPFALFISISSNENGLPLANNDFQSQSQAADKTISKPANLVRSLITKSLAALSAFLAFFGVNMKFGRPDPSNPNHLYI